MFSAAAIAGFISISLLIGFVAIGLTRLGAGEVARWMVAVTVLGALAAAALSLA